MSIISTHIFIFNVYIHIYIYIYYTISYTINKSRRQSVSNMKAAGSRFFMIASGSHTGFFTLANTLPGSHVLPGPTCLVDLACSWMYCLFCCSTPAWFCTSCCHFDGCFDVFALCATGLLRRFLYPMLNTLAFVPNAFYTQKLSKYGLFQNHGLHTCFGLN